MLFHVVFGLSGSIQRALHGSRLPRVMLLLLAAGGLVSVTAGPALAATYTFTGTGGNWSTLNNWSGSANFASGAGSVAMFNPALEFQRGARHPGDYRRDLRL